jgi:hypothetical protein
MIQNQLWRKGERIMKFPKRFLVVLTLVLTGLVLIACKPGEETVVDADPVFAGVGAASIQVYEDFDPLAGVTATDAEDGNLTTAINVKSNTVDTTVVGTYEVVYEVVDSAGNRTTVTRTVSVTALDEEDYPLAQYMSGVDLSKLPGEEKAKLFAAAERYLIENVYGGVPLYYSESRVLYSDRVQLYSPNYNSVLGFGTAFSQFTKDDSNVLMYGSTYGNANEYTWRGRFETDPVTLNTWISDDSATSDFNDMWNGALYDFFFDETKEGYEILPSLAKSEPIPINPEVINGKTYAKIWQIEVKDDLKWFFHPNTDVSGLAEGYDDLDASDWLWTWQYALQNKWFRSRTGGGDFVSQGIKNAAEYLAGKVDLEDVGLRLAEGKTNTIELEYAYAKSTFDIKYGFAGGVLQPINQELFEELGEDYGTTPETVAASGIYYFDTWTPGQLLIFKKNNLHPLKEMYHFTGYQYRYVKGTDNIFAEFLAGRLESASIPSAQVQDYLSNPSVKIAPDATSWRLMINAFGSTDARDAYIAENPGVGLSETWEPEPILSYLSMRQALYYGFDRKYAAVDLVKLYQPQHTLFTPSYMIDAESQIGVRDTDEGQAVFDDFAGATNGFVPDAAVDLFKEAVAAAIADGHYTAGTSSNYTVIELELYWASSGNTGAETLVANLIEQYEDLLVDDVNFVKIQINENNVAFPNNYYNFMMKAHMDLGIGGISGSLLDAPSFLDVFSDDNRGGFTLNWGIDTSTPNIPVAYTNMQGKEVYEKWSFNALVEALNGKTYIRDGNEQTAFASVDALVNAYIDLSGNTLVSVTDETVEAAVLTGLATGFEYEEVLAKKVTTTLGDTLYVIGKNGADYELIVQSSFLTVEDAIFADSGYESYYLDHQGPLTDAEIAANEYIATSYGYESIADVIEDLKIQYPAGAVQVYAVDWNGWSDAYVVAKIGNYYIALKWL